MQVTDPEGGGATSLFNAFGEETQRTTAISGSSARIDQTTYDQRGQAVQQRADFGGVNVTTTAEYDAFGRLVRSVDGNNNATTQAYDRLGRVITQTRPAGMGYGLLATTTSTYDAFSRVLTQTDALGQATRYAYTNNNRTVTVTTPEGISVTTTHNAQGQTLWMTDGNGQTTHHRYDADGHLVETQRPDGLSTVNTYDNADRLLQTTDAAGHVVAYGYDAADRVLTRTVDPSGLALQTTYTYDALGRQVRVVDPAGQRTDIAYDRKGQVLTQTVDPAGLALQTRYTYDLRGEVLTVTLPDNSVTQYTYDKLGRRTAEVVDPTGLALSTTYFYDNNGNLTSKVDATSQRTRYAYDERNQLVFTVDPAGGVVENRYDAKGRITQVRSYANAISVAGLATAPTLAQVRALAVANALDTVEYRQYDRDDRLASTVNALGEVTLYTYDGNGNLLTMRRLAQRIEMAWWTPGTPPIGLADDSRDQQTFNTYDNLNRLRTSRNGLNETTYWSYDAVGNLLSRSLGARSEYFVYDAAHRLVRLLDTSGAVVDRELDGAGRTVKETRYANLTLSPADLQAPASDASRDLVTRHVFDAAGRERFTVDAMGGVTEQRFNANSQVTEQVSYLTRVNPNVLASVTALSAAVVTATGDRRVRFTYDNAQRVRLKADGTGAVTQYTYDGIGHVVKEVEFATRIGLTGTVTTPAGNAADHVTLHTYDAAGRRSNTVDALGGVTAFKYDAKGNLVQRLEYAGRSTLLPAVGSTTANAATMVSQAAASAASTAANNHVWRQAYDAQNRAIYSVDALGAVSAQRYDAFGQLVMRTAYATALTSSALAALPTVPLASNFTSLATSPNDRTTLDTYDVAGRLRHSVDAAGYVTSRQYNALGQLTQLTLHKQPLTQLGSNTGFDAIEARIEAFTAANKALDQSTHYTYDTAGHLLITADALNHTEVQAYDGTGARISRTDQRGFTWDYGFDAAGNLIEQRDPAVDTSTVVTDGYGNLVLWSTASERAVTRFDYDGAGQLSGKTEAYGKVEQRTTSYQYDGEGRLVKTTLPPVNVYDNAAIANLAGSPADGLVGSGRTELVDQILSTQTIYDAFGNAVTQIDAAGNKTHRVYDVLDQTRFEVDALGYFTEQRFDRFGNVSQFTRFAQALSTPPATVPTLAAMEGAVVNLQGNTLNRTVTTVYDVRNQATRITQPEVWMNTGNGAVGKLANPITEYVYDTFGQTVQQRQLLEPTVGATPAVWAITKNVFDLRGNQVATIDPMGYVTTDTFDFAGNPATHNEYFNALAASAYNTDTAFATFAAQFREPSYLSLAAFVPPAAILPTPKQEDRKVVYEYDGLNRKTAQTLLNTEYSTAADPTTRITTDLTTRYGYDAVGNLVTTTDALGYVATTNYDALGRISSVQSPGAVINGSPQQPLTSFYRDALGNAVGVNQQGITDADRVTLTRYDSLGHAVQVTQVAEHAHLSVSQFMSYHANGEVAKQWQAATGEDGVTHTLFNQFQYDALGRQTAILTPGTTSFVNSNLVGITSSDVDAGVVIQDMAYNAFGEVVSRGNSRFSGQRDTFSYDNGGRLVRKFTSEGNRAGTVSFMLYDLMGRQTVAIESNGVGDLSTVLTAQAADPIGQSVVRRTTYQLDLLGRAVKVTLPQRTNPDMTADYSPEVFQSFDRWNNLLTQSDARDATWITTYRYDASNQVVQRLQAYVGVRGADGSWTGLTPTTEVYRDALGREIAQKDANQNVERKVWDASGNLVQELHADGGIVTHGYNAFGEKTSLLDAMGNRTDYVYDRLGRNVAISNPATQAYSFDADYNLVDHGSQSWGTTMTYDQAGRRLTQTNGAGETVHYVYDARGNIISTVDAMGHQSVTAYDGRDRVIGERNANGDVTTQQIDYFGQKTLSTDMFGANTAYQYDQAGQLLHQTSSRGQDLLYQYDSAGNLVHVTDNPTGKATHYSYDKAGNRLSEQTSKDGSVFQNQQMAYDAAGRLVYIEALDGIRITRDYDAVGNLVRQQVITDTYALPSTTEGMEVTVVGKAWTQVGTESYQTGTDPVTGQPIMGTRPVYGYKEYSELRNQITTQAGTRKAQTQWFAYDSMNRQTLVDGAVNGYAQDQANLTADQGHILTYDLNGNRTSDTKFGRLVTQFNRQQARDEAGNLLLNENGEPQYGVDFYDVETGPIGSTVKLGAVTELYTYDAMNRVSTVVNQTLDINEQPLGQLIDTRLYDAAGRMVQSGVAGLNDNKLSAETVGALTGQALTASGVSTRRNMYNAAGQLIDQKVTHANGKRSYEVHYDQIDAVGNVLQHSIVDDDKILTFTHEYEKWGSSYQEKMIHGTRSDNNTPSDAITTYDVNGHIQSVSETQWPVGATGYPGRAGVPGYENDEGRWIPEQMPIPADQPDPPMVRSFVTDMNGTMLRKYQDGRELRQLVVANQVVSTYGKGVDPDTPFDKKGKLNYTDQGTFGTTYKEINSRTAGGDASYTTREGDTLRAVAQGIWGDANLWYRLADTNGLSGTGPDARLGVGTRLKVPNIVGGTHNTSETARPYDPSEMVGDTTPNMPAPPRKEGCGGFGQLIVLVVAVVVAYFVGAYLGYEAGFSVGNVIVGAFSAAVGSIAGQAVGLMIGAQQEISWKAIAMAAIGGAVGGAMRGVNVFGEAGNSQFIQAANVIARAAITTAATQRVAMNLGLQKHFDWKNVAASAVGALAGHGMGMALGGTNIHPIVSNAIVGGFQSLTTAYTDTRLHHKEVKGSQMALAAFQGAFAAGLGAWDEQRRADQYNEQADAITRRKAAEVLQRNNNDREVAIGTPGRPHVMSDDSREHIVFDPNAGYPTGPSEDDKAFLEVFANMKGASYPSAGDPGWDDPLVLANAKQARTGYGPGSKTVMDDGSDPSKLTLDLGEREEKVAREKFEANERRDWIKAQQKKFADIQKLLDANSRAAARAAYIANESKEYAKIYPSGAGDVREYVAPPAPAPDPLTFESTSIPPMPETTGNVTVDRVIGGAQGVAANVITGANVAVNFLANNVLIIGDILTGGINRDSSIIDQAYLQQGAFASGVKDLFSSPIEKTTDAFESIAKNYDEALEVSAQGRDIEAARRIASQTAAIAETVLGGTQAVRGLASAGAAGAQSAGLPNWNIRITDVPNAATRYQAGGRSRVDLERISPDVEPPKLNTDPAATIRKNASIFKQYVREVEEFSKFKLGAEQKANLKDFLREPDNGLTKLSPQEAKNHRWSQSTRENLIKQWEEKTRQEWPKYSEDKISQRGNVYIRKGEYFDAHEVIPNQYNAPHEWWNVVPAERPNAHQGGIHGTGSGYSRIVDEF